MANYKRYILYLAIKKPCHSADTLSSALNFVASFFGQVLKIVKFVKYKSLKFTSTNGLGLDQTKVFGFLRK